MNAISSRTGTAMHVDRVGIRLPKSISIDGLYLEDLQKDTLIYAGNMLVDLRIMALLRNNLHVKSFSLSDVSVKIQRAASDERYNYDFLIQAFGGDDIEVEETDSDANPWVIHIDKVQLKRLAWLFDDEKEGLYLAAGFEHLAISPELLLPESRIYRASHLVLDGGTLDFQRNGSMRDLEDFHPDHVSVANLSIDASDIIYQSDSLGIQLQSMHGILLVDLPFFFVPALGKQFGDEHEDEKIHIRAHVSGSPDTLHIHELDAGIPGIASLQMKGILGHILHPENMGLQIDTLAIHAAPGRLNPQLTEVFIPKHFVLPDTLMVHAAGMASLNQTDVSLSINTHAGHAQLTALYAHSEKEPPTYDAILQFRDWQAGHMLGIDALADVVSGTLVAKGRGMVLRDMDSQFTLSLDETTFNGYRYTDLRLAGSVEQSRLYLSGEYQDEMLHANLLGSVDLLGDHQRLEALLGIHHINPMGLGFSEAPFTVNTQLSADIRLVGQDFFEGYVRMDGASLTDESRTYTLDSIVLITAYDDDLFHVNMESGIAQLNYNGNVSPLLIGHALANHLNQYIEMPLDVADQADGLHFFEMDLLVRSSDWFTQVLFPDLHVLEPFVFHVAFNSAEDRLIVEGAIPELHYANIYAKNLVMRSGSEPAQLDYHVGMNLLEVGGIEFMNPKINGRMYDDKIGVSLSFDNQKSEPWYQLSGELTTNNDQYNLVLDPDILIHGEAWHVPPDHAIIYGDESLWVQNFALSNQQSRLTAQSFYRISPDSLNTPASSLALSFQTFDLGGVPEDTGLPDVSGILNGSVELHELFTGLTFTSDLTIDRFGIQDDTIGDISLQVASPDADIYLFHATVDNYGNQARLSGQYQAGEGPAIDLDFLLTRFDLGTIAGFVEESVDDLTGQVTGNLKIKGNPEAPDFSGNLRFSETSGLARMPNIRFSLQDESVRFDRSSIHFDNFSIRDGMGRIASLNGQVFLTDYNNPGFDLGLTSRNFLAMNVLPGQNELFHGRVLLSSDLRLIGDLSRPRVEGNLSLNEGSSLELKVPQSVPDAIGDAGIVVFLHPDSLFVSDKEFVKRQEPYMTAFDNLMVNVNMEIDPLTDVRILIDEYAGDFLEVKGGGLISYGTDPGGRISLTGRYELAAGTYLLTFYDVIRRQFVIRSGSTITWSGDPQNPAVDIRAVYAIRTTAHELFGSPAAGASQMDQRLRQSFPFLVSLDMKGSLLNPDIRFDIALAPDQQDALDGQLQARLRELNLNESELNKQVFALLMIGGFVPDNPLDAGFEGPGLSSAARSSASKLLTQQLNRLSEQRIRGVNIRFDIASYEDFTTGEARGQTQLNLEVSKNFFDERLKLTVGGNIEVEDETKRTTNAGEIAGDFALEYLLNPKGTLIMKGFRRKEFQDVFEGQLIETGVSLKFNRSYNEFRELFEKSRTVEQSNSRTVEGQ